MTYCYTEMNSPVGRLKLFAKDNQLTAIFWDNQDFAPLSVAAKKATAKDTVLREAKKQLQEYFAGKRTTFDLSLAPKGTDFQQQVWKALRKIPHGKTWSYSDIAKRIAKPNASRAVGAAIGKNPLSIVVPCHRVIGANGKLTGFAGGLEKKAILLNLEGHEYFIAGDNA